MKGKHTEYVLFLTVFHDYKSVVFGFKTDSRHLARLAQNL